jgi:hypothetical protein
MRAKLSRSPASVASWPAGEPTHPLVADHLGQRLGVTFDHRL